MRHYAVGGRLRTYGLLSVAIASTIVVYRPLLRCFFHDDDFLLLYQLVNEPLGRFIFHPHGGHLNATRNALTALFHLAFGTEPRLYFATVLATHVANVGMLFVVIRRFTRSRLLAAFGATLWGTAALHHATLDWYAVYGQVVAATALLVLLLGVSRAATLQEPPPRRALVTWPCLLLAGATSFGIGIGIAAVFPLVALLLVPPSRERSLLLAIVAAVAAALPFVYRGLLSLYLALGGSPQEVFIARFVSAFHTPLAAATMMLLFPAYAVAALTLGTISGAAPEFPAPASIAVAVAFVAGLAVLLVWSDASERRHVLALLAVTLAIYGMIAAGRAYIFLRPGLVTGVTEARYHYAGAMPVTALLCLVLRRAGTVLRVPPVVAVIVFAGWVATIATDWARTPTVVDTHPRDRTETYAALAAIRARVAETSPGREVRIPTQTFGGVGIFLASQPAAFPGWAAVFAIYFPDDVVDGHRVVFEVTDPKVVAAARGGRRSANLIVLAGATVPEPVRPGAGG